MPISDSEDSNDYSMDDLSGVPLDLIAESADLPTHRAGNTLQRSGDKENE
jgi:hypothetical protein